MKIYLIANLDNYEYARFAHTGVWVKTTRCKACYAVVDKGITSLLSLSAPLQIEWEPDSNIIGDFSWCGYTVIVTEKVKQFFLKHKFECDFGMVDIHKSTTPKRSRKTVPFPYEGPTLHWLIPKIYIALDEVESELEIKSKCSVCGSVQYQFKAEKIVIPKACWNGSKIFRVKQFIPSSATFITEKGLEEILSQKFTNFWFREAG